MTCRINLISGPRNISTALMYAFANRDDTTVVDEPMYAYFLNESGDDHPGRQDILDSQPLDMEEVKSTLIFNSIDTPIYFIKGMAKHYVDVDYSFLVNLKNVFLIRNPAQLLSSFVKVIPNPKMKDIGLKREWDIFNYLKEQGQTPLVMDSNDVLADPESGLKTLCKHLDIPFNESMLSWEKGPIKEDGIWAPHWYKNVHASTGFAPQNTSQPEINDELKGLLKESLYYYDKLNVFNILNSKDMLNHDSAQGL